jgi:hypothetical protein
MIGDARGDNTAMANSGLKTGSLRLAPQRRLSGATGVGGAGFVR